MLGSSAFTGPEAEGPEQGVRTLFIPRGAGQESLLLFAQTHGIGRVYFGAGGHRGLVASDMPLLEACIKDDIDVLAEIECHDKASLRMAAQWPDVQVVLVADVPLACHVNHIKLQDPVKLIWHCCPISYTTLLSDTRYKNDKEI